MVTPWIVPALDVKTIQQCEYSIVLWGKGGGEILVEKVSSL